MDNELKMLLDEQMKTFESFKGTNDLAQAEIKKLGAADAVTLEAVGKINGALDKIGAEIKASTARLDEIEKRTNRPQLSSETAALEAKHAAEFGRLCKGGRELSTDEFRAYKAAYGIFLRQGKDALVGDAERKALSVGSDADGGYLVTPDVSGRIVAKIFETSEMRAVASVQVISSDKLTGMNDLNEAGAGWVAEQAARPATATPQIGKWEIVAQEMYVMPEATQQLLDDAAIDVEGWLAGKVADKMVRLENAAFVTGDGIGKPRGFASYTTAATADATRAWGTLEHVATGTAGGFGTAPNGSDKLIDLVHKVKAVYRTGGRFAMTKATVGAVRQLKANAEYIWLPSMDAARPSSLLGYPVVEFEDMAAFTVTDSLAIGFGNFALGYQIVDRAGFRTLRDPFTNKPFVRFYTTRRVGGDVLHFEAIKFLKFGTA